MLVQALLAVLMAPVAHAGATASNFRAETKLGANYWNAAAAIDEKLDTCWMVPGESENLGEYVILDVPRGEVDKIGMIVGWAKTDETFSDYPRIKSVKVEVFSYNDERELFSVGSADASFEDKNGWQVIDLPDMKLGTEDAGGKVKITVTGVYPGKDFPNIAVSELLVHMKEFDAAPKVTGVSGSDSGHPQESLFDTNPKTFWAAPAEGASITLDSVGFGLSKVGIAPGPKDYARAKKVKISVGNRSIVSDLPDAAGPQWAQVPAMQGYSGSAWGELTVEILETWPGSKNSSVGISEITAKATTFESL